MYIVISGPAKAPYTDPVSKRKEAKQRNKCINLFVWEELFSYI